ncbi:hypothetical protein BDV32DRAFT_83842 [Aspergillus pseudonomiae]|nr:hypothetical protein BDV32DRAFT_83842 [Aspergillus pseudonomiae]
MPISSLLCLVGLNFSTFFLSTPLMAKNDIQSVTQAIHFLVLFFPFFFIFQFLVLFLLSHHDRHYTWR